MATSSVEPGHARQPVALEPRAPHEHARLHVARGRRHHHATVAPPDPRRAGPGADHAPAPRELRGVGPRHLRVVDDPGLRHEERRDPGGVRLVLAELLGAEASHPIQAVGLAASLELVEPRHLVGARGDDDLPAPLEADPVLLAEALEERAPASARRRLEGAGFVVEARVDHAAVVARLVRGEGRLLLQHDERQPRAAGEQCQRRREADDASSDDDGVDAHHGAPRALPWPPHDGSAVLRQRDEDRPHPVGGAHLLQRPHGGRDVPRAVAGASTARRDDGDDLRRHGRRDGDRQLPPPRAHVRDERRPRARGDHGARADAWRPRRGAFREPAGGGAPGHGSRVRPVHRFDGAVGGVVDHRPAAAHARCPDDHLDGVRRRGHPAGRDAASQRRAPRRPLRAHSRRELRGVRRRCRTRLPRTAMSQEHTAFRPVPRTGVIYVTTEAHEARLLADRSASGATSARASPRRATSPGAPPRVQAVDDRRRRSGVRAGRRASGSCARRSRRSTTASTGAGMPSQYSRRERVRLGRRARGAHARRREPRARSTSATSCPTTRRTRSCSTSSRRSRAIPILLEGERGYAFGADELRREILGRGLSAHPDVATRATRPGKLVEGEELAALGARRRASSTARCSSTSSTRTTSTASRPGALPIESAARYVEDVDRDPVVIFDGLTKNWRYPGWRVTWTRRAEDGHRGARRARARSSTAAARKPLQRAAVALLAERPRRGRDDGDPARRSAPSATICSRGLERLGVRVDRAPDGTFYVWGSVDAAAAAAQRRHGLLPRRARGEGHRRARRVLRREPGQAAQGRASRFKALRALLVRAPRWA